MRIEELKATLDARPFRPFFIRTADGRDVRITHPDAVAWGNRESRTAICALPDGGYEIVDIALVTALGIPAEASPAAESKAEGNGA